MNITLNQKDADYIANYCRNKMKTLDKNVSEAIEDIKKKTAKVEAFSVIIDANEDAEVKTKLAELKKASEESIKSIQADYTEEYSQLEKILTLVMTGSENS